MVEGYHLQQRPPDAGRFRIGSLRDRAPISVCTGGRIMALNQQGDDDRPQGARPRRQKPAQPHPYQASHPHQYGCMDGRQRALALAGVTWWSMLRVDGYSRPRLAGAVAPVEASWGTLMVLSPAGRRSGAPHHLSSDSGGAFTSNDVTAVWQRWPIAPTPLLSPQGARDKKLRETHGNIHRRLSDSPCSLPTPPAECEQAQQPFLETYNTTAHAGLRKDGWHPPVPRQVLGQAQGRLDTPEELACRFSRAFFPRTPNQYGGVTLPSYHF